MRATGIVRRIDDLGRIVIPKELRRTLRIREGDPLEIFTGDGGEVIFKKYSRLGELSEHAAAGTAALWRSAGIPAAVCDREHFIVAAPARREFSDLAVPDGLLALIDSRKASIPESPISLSSDSAVVAVAPVVVNSDVVGAVVALNGGELRCAGDQLLRALNITAELLAAIAE